MLLQIAAVVVFSNSVTATTSDFFALVGEYVEMEGIISLLRLTHFQSYIL